MIRLAGWFLVTVLLLTFLLFNALSSHSQGLGAGTLALLDRQGHQVVRITDGDQVKIHLALPAAVQAATRVAFQFSQGGELGAGCTVAAGSSQCDSDLISSLGWRWDAQRQAHPFRELHAIVQGQDLGLKALISVTPRPVVMVHGFISSWEAWKSYLGPDGFLASIGLPGYAVGDGQVEGVMNTGSLVNPDGRSNTISQNAEILGKYIDGVKKLTGAEQVDLVTHSMGGLISRYYIDRVMKDRDVGQLIMLGTPQNGTDCSILPASLGLYLPASLEIRPSYLIGIFNQHITHRRGVPFHALAGTMILEPVRSPCTSVPSDVAVSLQSASGIPLEIKQILLLHVDLNKSPQVFNQYVQPQLQSSSEKLVAEPDPSSQFSPEEVLQFTRVITGQIQPGGSQQVTIPIESGVSVASFALFDTTHSLTVTVQGASGNILQLDMAKNGVVVNDPASLVYLGYGFNRPKPGLWKVTLKATSRTTQTARFALFAQFQGGARLESRLDKFTGQVGETIQLSSRLEFGGQPLAVERAEAQALTQDGQQISLPFTIQAGQVQAAWKPPRPGLYALEIQVDGLTPEGLSVERSAHLALEVAPQSNTRRDIFSWLVLLVVPGCIGLLGLGGLAWLTRRWSRSRKIPA